MNRQVLNVAQVGKCYATYPNNFARFAEWFGIRVPHSKEFWAVRDVNFSLEAGKALALIGQNGAGKSTLLKLITGTVRPTTGSVQVAGRVSALLELGIGFNPDLTGRQNIYLAGGLTGLSTSELDALVPGIEDFAELGEFIDQPLRVYSSGMQARLAFSVATAVRPDILIVDEVLSVGDSYFQHKSFDRIRQFKQQGTAILFVTHGMGDVRALCDRVLLMDQGTVLKDGLPDEVVDCYNALIAARENAKLTLEQRRVRDGWLVTRSGTGDAVISKLLLTDAETGESVSVARVGQKLRVRAEISINNDISTLVLGYMLRDRTGHVIWGTNTWHTQQKLTALRKGQTVTYDLEYPCNLGPGTYSITHALSSTDTHLTDNYEWTDNALIFDVVNADRPPFIGCNWIDARFHLVVDEPLRKLKFK